MKHLFKIYFLFFSIYCTAQTDVKELLEIYNTRSIPYISVESLRMKQSNDSVIILDAREREEFDVSHIASAKYVGFSEFSAEEISKLIVNKDKLIVVYCSLGIRSEKISEKLKKEGFTKVENLYGGIFEWKNKAYPVVDSTGTETENIHGYSQHWSKWLHNGTIILKE